MAPHTLQRRAKLGLHVVLSLLGGATVAHASVITAPVSSTGSTFVFEGFAPVTNLFNQSGLSANYVSGVTDFDTFNATHDASSAGDAFSSPASFPGTIDFDLGSLLNIEQFALWNDAQTSPFGRGVNSFTIFTDDNSAFTSPTNVGTFNAVGFEVNSSAMQVFDLTDSVGQFVRWQINSNHGRPNLQIGEVAFATSAVPEASEALVALLGVSGLVFGARRRKN